MRTILPHSLAALAIVALSACNMPADPAASDASGADMAALSDTPVSSTPLPGTVPSDAPATAPSDEDQCNAAKAGDFVGREADAANKAELEAAVSPVSAIRWVGPGTMTTEDYSLSRLNVMLDAGNRITSAHCG